MKKFTLYWRDGRRQVFEGHNIATVFSLAGYGSGARCDLDFHVEGDNHDYEYVDGKWTRKDNEKSRRNS